MDLVDCLDVLNSGQNASGVYHIRPGVQEIQVQCDMEIDGGGWTVREKGRDLTQFYDKSPIHSNKNPKRNVTTQNTPPKPSITQRLRTDLGWSVRVTTITLLVWLNLPTSHNNRVIKSTHFYKKKIANNPPYRDWGPMTNQSGEVIKMWYTNIYSQAQGQAHARSFAYSNFIFGNSILAYIPSSYIVFANADVTPPCGPPYWITAHGLDPVLPCKLAKFSN